MNISPAERRALLKESTWDLHRELDTLAGQLDLTDRTDYCKFMLANAGPVIGLELALEESGVECAIPRWPERRRRFKLAQDLLALGLSADPVEVRSNLSVSEMFGIVYVLEGSRLGAEIVFRRVSQTKNESVRAARSFIGANDATLWSSYLRTLQDASTPLEPTEAVEAARYAFALFKTAFESYCSPAPTPAYSDVVRAYA